MLIRHVVVITVLIAQGASSQENGADISNIILNKAFSIPSQNQIGSNQGFPINVQNSVQQTQNPQQVITLQKPNASQIGNIPTAYIQTTKSPTDGKQSKGYHQSLVVQEPMNLQMAATPQNFQNIDQQNAMLGNIQLHDPQSGIPSILQGSSAYPTQTLLSIPSNTVGAGPVRYAQNDPSSVTAVPAYIIDGPLTNSYIPMISDQNVNNQAALVAVPQQNGYPQYALVNPGQPSQNIPQFSDNNLLSSLLSNSYGGYPSSGQNIPPQNSKPSKLKALLPLLLDLFKDRNQCDCCSDSQCSNKKKNKNQVNVWDNFKPNSERNKDSGEEENMKKRSSREHKMDDSDNEDHEYNDDYIDDYED